MALQRSDLPVEIEVTNETNRRVWVDERRFEPHTTRRIQVRTLPEYMRIRANSGLKIEVLKPGADRAGIKGDGPDHQSQAAGGSDHDRSKRASAKKRREKAKTGGGS